jgi:uncharacterized protein (UPF0335 family)
MTVSLGLNSANQLKSFVERVERLAEEKKLIADDIRDVYAEAKSNGFDVKALREVVKLRKRDKDEQQAFEETVETYRHALGDLADTPLGRAMEPTAEHAAPTA